MRIGFRGFYFLYVGVFVFLLLIPLLNWMHRVADLVVEPVQVSTLAVVGSAVGGREVGRRGKSG